MVLTHPFCSLILERSGSRVHPVKTMRPYPDSLCLLVLAASLYCTVWLVRALLRRNLNVIWLALLAVAISIGGFFGTRFAAVTYDYTPGWRVVGFPMFAEALKYKAQLNQWWGYVDWPPPAVIAANFILWTAAPSLILFPPAWAYVRLFHRKSKSISEPTPAVS